MKGLWGAEIIGKQVKVVAIGHSDKGRVFTVKYVKFGTPNYLMDDDGIMYSSDQCEVVTGCKLVCDVCGSEDIGFSGNNDSSTMKCDKCGKIQYSKDCKVEYLVGMDMGFAGDESVAVVFDKEKQEVVAINDDVIKQFSDKCNNTLKVVPNSDGTFTVSFVLYSIQPIVTEETK